MRLSWGQGFFHALLCFAVGLISHNAWETRSLNPPRQNVLVYSVSEVAHSRVLQDVTAWAESLMGKLASQLKPHAPLQSAPAPATVVHPVQRLHPRR